MLSGGSSVSRSEKRPVLAEQRKLGYRSASSFTNSRASVLGHVRGLGSTSRRSSDIGSVESSGQATYINLLELKAAFLALQEFRERVTRHSIVLMLDNTLWWWPTSLTDSTVAPVGDRSLSRPLSQVYSRQEERSG